MAGCALVLAGVSICMDHIVRSQQTHLLDRKLWCEILATIANRQNMGGCLRGMA